MSLQTQQQIRVPRLNTQTAFSFGEASGSVKTEPKPSIVENSTFVQLTDTYAHLMKDPDVKGSNGAFCLFQPLGCCQKGPVINGFCAYHIKQFNVVLKKDTVCICNENNKTMEITETKSFALVPQNLAKLAQNPEAGIIWPLIETEDFNINKLAFFNTPAFDMSDQRYAEHVNYLKMFLSHPSMDIPEDYRRHRTYWRNYMSHRFNPKNVPLYCLLSNGKLLNLNECTLVTQAFLCLFVPQSNGIMAAPSSLIVQPEGIYLNFSACAFGTTENCKGSLLYAPTLARPPLVVDQITTSIDNKLEYHFNHSNTC